MSDPSPELAMTSSDKAALDSISQVVRGGNLPDRSAEAYRTWGQREVLRFLKEGVVPQEGVNNLGGYIREIAEGIKIANQGGGSENTRIFVNSNVPSRDDVEKSPDRKSALLEGQARLEGFALACFLEGQDARGLVALVLADEKNPDVGSVQYNLGLLDTFRRGRTSIDGDRLDKLMDKAGYSFDFVRRQYTKKPV